MKLGVLCLVFAVAETVWGDLSPAGENVCMSDEKYIDVIQVRELVPVKVYRVEWCWRIPPRCTVETQTVKPTLVSRQIPRVRIVPKCCLGYEEVVEESKCVPICSKPCLNGTCTAPDTCSCESGFHGSRCEKPCSTGTWGRGCLEKCVCYNGATCDGVHGHCACTPGWEGYRCEFPCEPGRYGMNCEERCNCYGELLCNHVSGECEPITESTTDNSSASTEEAIFELETTDWSTETGDNSSEINAEISEIDNNNLEEVSSIPKNTTHIEEIIIELDSTTIIIDEVVTAGPDIVHVYAEKVNEEDYQLLFHPEGVTTENSIKNETVEENEIEGSKDFSSDVKKIKFNLTILLENISIISGVFVLIFVVIVAGVVYAHYKKVKKMGFDCQENNNVREQVTMHRFYGGTVLPGKTVLDNQLDSPNYDLEIEQPKMMTFKPIPEGHNEYFMKSDEPTTEKYRPIDVDQPISAIYHADYNRNAQYGYDVPKSTTFVPDRLKYG